MVFRKSVKFYVGLILFCIGIFLPLLAFIVPFLGFPVLVKTVITSILIVGGPEIFMILGVIFAGKETMKFIKGRFWSFFTTPSISKTRHYIGVAMILFSILANWVLAYLFILFESKIDEEMALILVGTADSIFVISFFILGIPFWRKLINLFTWTP